jgi:hypothetical protein
VRAVAGRHASATAMGAQKLLITCPTTKFSALVALNPIGPM